MLVDVQDFYPPNGDRKLVIYFQRLGLQYLDYNTNYDNLEKFWLINIGFYYFRLDDWAGSSDLSRRDQSGCCHEISDCLDNFSRPFHLRIMTGALDKYQPGVR